MPTFIKKPIAIEAFQMPLKGMSYDALAAWMYSDDVINQWASAGTDGETTFIITTVDGATRVNPGDWIIKNSEAKLSACSDITFKATYWTEQECAEAERIVHGPTL